METRHVQVHVRGDMLVIEWSTADGAHLSSRTFSRDEVLRDPNVTLLGADVDWPIHLRGTPIILETEDDALRDALDAHPEIRPTIRWPRSRADAVPVSTVILPSYSGDAGTRGFSENSIESFNTGGGGSEPQGKPPGWTDNG